MMDWLNPSVGWGAFAFMIIAGCLAVAWYFPPFRKLALTIAGAVAGAFALYRKGAKDAAARKQRQWDEAERKSVERGNQARRDAERDVRDGRVRDRFDRDDL